MEENLELWQKLFAAMNEKRDEIPDESNYGAYLLAALDLVKDQFTEDELKTLTEGSEQIRDLEDQIQPLQEQYAALQPAGDGEDGGMNDAVPRLVRSRRSAHTSRPAATGTQPRRRRSSRRPRRPAAAKYRPTPST